MSKEVMTEWEALELFKEALDEWRESLDPYHKRKSREVEGYN